MIASGNQGMKAQPQAGLAALAQPAQAPRGMPSGSIQQIMERAKSMSDAQLADILSGKSMDVPQYVAMTEAMGRKSLRNAVQGQQAMAQAKQPSVKDKFLTEEAQAQMAEQMAGQGIAALPAPNMDSMDMAGGGIIAFEEGGDVPGYYEGGTPLTEEQIQQLLSRGSLRRSDEEIAKAQEGQSLFGMSQRTRAAMKDKAKSKSYTPAELEALAAGQGAFPEGSAALPGANMAAAPDSLGRFMASPAPAAPKATMTGVGAPSTGANPYAIPEQGPKSKDYLSKLEGMSDKQRAGLDAIKTQGGGEALMQLASGILSRPTLAQGIGAALPVVSSTAAATRKETRAVENAANEYDLNLAKAQEAAEAGDMDRAFQYKKLAEEAKYRAQQLGLGYAGLNQDTSEVRTLKALAADPKLAALYKGAGKTNVISREAALKEWSDLLPAQQKKYGTFNDYYASVNSTMGGGTDLAAQAAAILASRSK